MELNEMIDKVHEALEGRYDLTGYDLHMIHGTLCEFARSSNSMNNDLHIPDVIKSLSDLDGKTIPVRFAVKKSELRISIDGI